MTDRDLAGLNAVFAELERRITALEARAMVAQSTRSGGEVKRLRAMAVALNKRLGKHQAASAAKVRRRNTIRAFAAAALPSSMLETNCHHHAVELATDVAFDLWRETEALFENLESEDVGQEPKATQ